MRSVAPFKCGTFHFFVAHDDPAEQARWFIANTPLGAEDFAPVVDIETLGENPPDDLPDRQKIFVEIVQQHYGVKPIVYTGPTFWDRNLGGGWGDHALWVAEYEVDRPKVPSGSKRWALWQHRGDAGLEGVERVVDLNRMADGFDLESLTISASGRGVSSEAGADSR
jgi:lysozyme